MIFFLMVTIRVFPFSSCSTDLNLLSPFHGIDEDGSVAQSGLFQIFKFTTSNTLYFTCQLDFCYTHADPFCAQVEYTMQTLCIWFRLIVRNKDICTSLQKKKTHVKQKVETNSLLHWVWCCMTVIVTQYEQHHQLWFARLLPKDQGLS